MIKANVYREYFKAKEELALGLEKANSVAAIIRLIDNLRARYGALIRDMFSVARDYEFATSLENYEEKNGFLINRDCVYYNPIKIKDTAPASPEEIIWHRNKLIKNHIRDNYYTHCKNALSTDKSPLVALSVVEFLQNETADLYFRGLVKEKDFNVFIDAKIIPAISESLGRADDEVSKLIVERNFLDGDYKENTLANSMHFCLKNPIFPAGKGMNFRLYGNGRISIDGRSENDSFTPFFLAELVRSKMTIKVEV